MFTLYPWSLSWFILYSVSPKEYFNFSSFRLHRANRRLSGVSRKCAHLILRKQQQRKNADDHDVTSTLRLLQVSQLSIYRCSTSLLQCLGWLYFFEFSCFGILI